MDAAAGCGIGLVGPLEFGVGMIIVVIVVRIELGELALWALALTKMRRGMKHGVDVGDVPSSAASLHIPISVQMKRFKVPGRVTPGFNETRDGPLGALSEVVDCGLWWILLRRQEECMVLCTAELASVEN
jgi:hypothetical protein